MKTNPSTKTCPKCGAPVPPEAPQGLCPKCVLAGAALATEAGLPPTATAEIPSLDRVAAAFPQLEILELIGRGGMGFVFKARQPHLDRFVALKLLPDKLAKDPQFTERFTREARTLARLSHPNIVSVFDFGQAGGFCYLMMEYVDGVNLRQAMRAGRFSPSAALAIVPKVCEALQFAHERGVLHRDIKPENILLDQRGGVKIADFGIAKLVGEEHPDVSLTATGAALGTMHYMAPEQIEKPATVDHRADIYSLGVVFYELLTGELPLGRFGPPSEKTPVDSRVDDVVMRTLEKEREKRFQSAGEMGTTVEHLTEVGAGSFKAAPPKVPGAERGPGGTIAIKPEHVLPELPKWSQKAVWAAVLVGVSLPVPVLMILVSFLRPHFWGHGWVGMLVVLSALSLPGLVGTILGWMALRDLRDSQGRLRGRGLAVFAAVALPLLLLLTGVGLFPFQIFPPGPVTPLGIAIMHAIPLAGLSLALWAIYAAARWSKTDSLPRLRRVLRRGYVCLAICVVAYMAPLTVFNLKHPTHRHSADVPTIPANTTPWIRFTFTAVELREVQGVRWLAIDYLDDVHGECQKSFPWETTIPGFKAETRTTEFLKDNDKDSPPVRHQRVEYRMPDSSPRDQLERLRDNLEKALKQKSFRLELGENEVPLMLFELPGAEGGSLQARIKVVPPLKNASASPQKSALGVVRLIAGLDYQNLALMRLESLPGHPLHEIVVRFSGPELPDNVALAPKATSGPHVVPSLNEDMKTPVTEPVASGDPIGTNQMPTASAIRVPCPGDYSFAFVLPDEDLAREADRQIKQSLAQPVSLASGQQIVLFTIGERKAWLEVHPFRPVPNKLAFFRRGGSPARIPGSNFVESAVATIPAGYELNLMGSLTLNNLNQSEPVFSTSLKSGRDEPGVYWITWYSLPNPQSIDGGITKDWELLIHDALGHELFRMQAPDELKSGWRRRWVGEVRTAKVGEPMYQHLFEKFDPPTVADRRGNYVTLEMTMQRLAIPTSAPNLSFGPVVERVVEEPAAPDSKWFDLDSGKSVPSPAFSEDVEDKVFEDWMRKVGVDVGASVRERGLLARGGGFVALPVQTTLWESANAQAVADLLSQTRPDGNISLMRADSSLPSAFVFKTREGGSGILQITGFTNHPPGVKIRYKLVQGDGTEGTEIRIRLAREQLAEARKKISAGVISQQEFADAERQLAVAEARGDAVAVARANLKFAEFALTIAKKKLEAGVISSSDLRIAESQRAIAEIDLNGAVKAAEATPK